MTGEESTMDESELKALIGEIITLCDPMFVYLVSSKHDNRGNVTSVKLCVVVDDGLVPSEQEKKLLVDTFFHLKIVSPQLLELVLVLCFAVSHFLPFLK